MTPKEALQEALRRKEIAEMTSEKDVIEYYDHVIVALSMRVPNVPIYEETNNIYRAYKRKCNCCGDEIMVSSQARPLEKFCRYCGVRLTSWTEDKE